MNNKARGFERACTQQALASHIKPEYHARVDVLWLGGRRTQVTTTPMQGGLVFAHQIQRCMGVVSREGSYHSEQRHGAKPYGASGYSNTVGPFYFGCTWPRL